MMRTLAIFVCVLGTMLAVSSLRAQDAGVRTAIEAGNKQFAVLFAKQDAAGVAALYTPNGEAYPPNGNVVRGRAELQKMWKSVMDSGISSASLTTSEVESSGDLAYESGSYELRTKDGKPAD